MPCRTMLPEGARSGRRRRSWRIRSVIRFVMSLSADLACSDRGDLRGGEGAMGIAADASPGPRPPSTVLNATCAVILLRAQRSSTYRRSAQLLRHIYRKSHGLGMRQGFSLRASYRAEIGRAHV